MNLLASIIIPNFNREELILQTLESCINQTYRPLEIIVIDDHSTDNSIKSIEGFIKNQKEINVSLSILTNKKKGAQAARNLGLELANGEFIQFLDSDDLLLPEKIEKEVNILLQKPELDLVYSKCQFFDAKGKKNQFWGRKLDGTTDDYFEFSWQTMCALYRKTAFDTFGNWNEELTINQDWEISIRAILSGAKIEFLDQVNSLIREHDGESIGKSSANNFSKDKLFGKEKSLNIIYEILIEKNYLDKNLTKKIRKRYLFILVQLGMIGEFGIQERIVQERKEFFPYVLQLILKIKSKLFYKTIWKLYAVT